MVTQILNTVLFVGLAAAALYLWWRRRDAAAAWLAGAWACLGFAVLVGALLPDSINVRNGWGSWLNRLGVVLPLVLYPYCLIRFAASFDRGRALSRVAGGITIMVSVSMFAFPYWPSTERPWWFAAWQLAFFVQWVGLSLIAAVRLWWAGRKEPAVTRRRMQLLGAGAIVLSAVILLPLLAPSSSPIVRAISTAMVCGSAACVLFGLAPPAWLRLIWRRAEQQQIYQLQLALIRAESRSEVATAVLPVLTGLLGCGAAAMLTEDNQVVDVSGKPEDVDELLDTIARAQWDLDQPGLVYARLKRCALVGQIGRYAPIFGSDEVRLFESTSLMVDSALYRIDSREELAQAHHRALEASRLKSEFLANMSHEIRTPINGVIGLTELLSVTALNEEQRAYTTTIQSSADALLSVLNDILDFSKIEAGKLDLNVMDFDVRAAVEDIVALLAGAANGKHIELAMVVDEDVPAGLHGDVGRVRQVLLNLAGNAVKFTESGEVVIRVSRVPAAGTDVSGPAPSTRCRFEVTDSGPGIPAESVMALFESFSQADTSSTRRHGGTGLGLAISKRLVELMGGTIEVETELGRGSRFWFELDLAPASASWIAIPPVTVLRNRSVLVVDDNAANRTILLQTAKAWQLEAVAAADVEQALAELQRRHDVGGHFDVAWIDHQMPGRNGTELARAMAADARYRDTARILLTSSGDRSGLDSGELHAHLTKPVRPSVLLECVTHLLARETTEPTGDDLATEAPAEAFPTTRPREALATAVAAPAVSADAVAKVISAAPKPAPGGPRVLVAEDNPVSQQVARKMLESLGCAVDIARTGSEVLEAARRRSYEMVFMDCQMPEMDGYEATAALRAQEGEARHTPVVALTASAMKGDAELCLKAGMDAYLTKPVRIADFREALTRWLLVPDDPTPTPSVDLTALSALSDDREEAEALVELFVETTSAQLEQLRGLVATGETSTLRRLCHALRGGALSMGADELGARCGALEAENGGVEQLSTQLSAIEEEFGRVRAFFLREFDPVSASAGLGHG